MNGKLVFFLSLLSNLLLTHDFFLNKYIHILIHRMCRGGLQSQEQREAVYKAQVNFQPVQVISF